MTVHPPFAVESWTWSWTALGICITEPHRCRRPPGATQGLQQMQGAAEGHVGGCGQAREKTHKGARRQKGIRHMLLGTSLPSELRCLALTLQLGGPVWDAWYYGHGPSLCMHTSFSEINEFLI
jgi:hypothetical protein